MEEIKNQKNLASDQGNNKKSNAAIIGIAIILILILLGVVFWFIFQFLMPNIKQKPSPQTSDNQTFCQQDSDCALIAAYKGCCPVCGSEAARKDRKESIEKTQIEQCANIFENCALYECPNHDYKAVCEQNKCVAKETPLVPNIDLSCEDLQKEIIKDSDNLNYCQTKEDCAVSTENLGCTFGCWQLVNKNITDDKFRIIKDKASDFLKRCQPPLCSCVPPPVNVDCVVPEMPINGAPGIGKCHATSSGAQSLNTNTSATPSNQYKIIGSFPSPGEASFIEKIGNTVFLTDITEGLLAIDVSDPAKPKLLSKLKIGNGGAYALAASANGSYLVVSGYGNAKVALVDVDMENPSAMKIMSEIDTKRSVQDMILVADRAYLAIDGPEIEILKVEKETSFPFALKGIISQGTMQIQSGGHAIGITDFWNSMDNSVFLVVAQGESGVGVYDLSMPATPKIRFTASVGYVSAVAMERNFVYAGIGDMVKVIDISTQKEIKSIDIESIWNLKVKDNILYVATGEEGVKIFDVSDPTTPKQVAIIDTPGRARDLVINGDYIYVADDRDDLQIIKKE